MKIIQMERQVMKRMIGVARVLAAVTICTATISGFALTLKNPSISMEQMTKEADDIVIGNVLSVEPTVVGRTLETRCQVHVQENLKNRSGEAPAGKTITVTLPGASLTTPPLTQYVSGVPYFAEGEEVLLFLRKPTPKTSGAKGSKAAAAPPANSYAASPKIVGWNQGRFSVVTNPASGKKMVARINLENYGMLNSSKEMRQVLDAIAAEKLPLIEQQVLRSADYAREARIKDPLEMTPVDTKNLKMDSALQRGATMQAIRQRGGIAAQHLDDFKAQIQEHLND